MPVSLTTEEFDDFYDGQPGWVVLTSIGIDGYPHSVPLGYFREGEHIYCGVVDGTKKIKNIEGNKKVALLIESGSTMADIKGAMIQGEATVRRGPDKVLELMRKGAALRGVPEDQLPTQARPGSAFIEVRIDKRISWDYSKSR